MTMAERKKFLTKHYPNMGRLWCAKELGISAGAVRSMCSTLGLRLSHTSDFFNEWQSRARQTKIGRKRPEHSKLMKRLCEEGKLPHITRHRTESEKVNISKKAKLRIATHGHPKGATGMHHTDVAKRTMSEASRKMWKNPDSIVNSDVYRQKLSDRMSLLHNSGKGRKRYSRGRMGTYDINGKMMFFRSLWEVNYALYLDYLVSVGYIEKWEYEKDTFWFEKIKRGVRSYKPDFKLQYKDGRIVYHEVKGWMDSKSKTKLKRMSKYHPDIVVSVVGEKEYKELKRNFAKILNFIE